MKKFYVIEGEHTNPNDIETILKNTEKKYGPFEEKEARPNCQRINSKKYR